MMKNEIRELLSQAQLLKPKDLIISDLKWKYLLWAIYRRKNILFFGCTRCGKTSAIRAAAHALNLPFFVFNLGSTQDPRATLIGNTVLKRETGTLFYESAYIKALKTKGAVILHDELTRATHDAWNILMPVFDPTLRFIRLDEQEDSATIKIEDVTLAATANIGSEYTATKTMDKALSARFPVKIEMVPLIRDELLSLTKLRYPDLDISNGSNMWNICEIANTTIKELSKNEPRLSSLIPTGTVMEMAQLIQDGFTLEEVAETVIYPEYSDDGGVESERIYIRQIVEKYIPKQGALNPMHNPWKK